MSADELREEIRRQELVVTMSRHLFGRFLTLSFEVDNELADDYAVLQQNMADVHSKNLEKLAALREELEALGEES